MLIEDCITYGNGTLTDGTKTSGDGNSNPAVVVENTVSTQNDKNFRFDYYTNAELLYLLKNVYSYETKEHNEDEVPSMAYGDTVYLFDGTKSANASGKVLEASALV